MRLAKQRQVPAYVVFSDRSLIDMARKRPRNEYEFGEVHGVGAAKLKEFGHAFLDAIQKHKAS
jgi:ATP-dependent DNA helicase RecQ